MDNYRWLYMLMCSHRCVLELEMCVQFFILILLTWSLYLIIKLGKNLFNFMFAVLSPNLIVFGSAHPGHDVRTRGLSPYTWAM